RDVSGQFLVCFFERDKDAGLVEESGAANQEFHCEERLAGAGATANQSRPASGYTAAGDFIKSGNAGLFLWQTGSIIRVITTIRFHTRTPAGRLVPDLFLGES